MLRIRDALGPSPNLIRQQLSEGRSLILEKAYGQARMLDLAKKNPKEYVRNVTGVYGAANGGAEDEKDFIAELILVVILAVFVEILGIQEKTVQLMKPL